MRYHHGRHRMVEVEVAARHAVDVGHRDLLDSHQVVIGRVQSVQRDRIGPDLGRSGDRILLELRLAALLQLGGLDQFGRHPVAGDFL